jgi:hypothetical protein
LQLAMVEMAHPVAVAVVNLDLQQALQELE